MKQKGDEVSGGDVIGEVQETETFTHKIMVPPGKKGTITHITSGSFTVDEVVCTLDDGSQITMVQRWPVRAPRPYSKK